MICYYLNFHLQGQRVNTSRTILLNSFNVVTSTSTPCPQTYKLLNTKCCCAAAFQFLSATCTRLPFANQLSHPHNLLVGDSASVTQYPWRSALRTAATDGMRYNWRLPETLINISNAQKHIHTNLPCWYETFSHKNRNINVMMTMMMKKWKKKRNYKLFMCKNTS